MAHGGRLPTVRRSLLYGPALGMSTATVSKNADRTVAPSGDVGYAATKLRADPSSAMA